MPRVRRACLSWTASARSWSLLGPLLCCACDAQQHRAWWDSAAELAAPDAASMGTLDDAVWPDASYVLADSAVSDAMIARFDAATPAPDSAVPDADPEVLPDAVTPLPPMPNASTPDVTQPPDRSMGSMGGLAVACSFEPIDPTLVVDNPRCPDGIYRTAGSVKLQSAQDVAALAGCTRIRGSVEVRSDSLPNLAGLESLRVIEGGLYIPGKACPPRSQCFDLNPALSSLTGLENLVCVGGDVTIDSMIQLKLGGLRALAEIGGSLNLSFYEKLVEQADLPALTRVFGDVVVYGVAVPNLTTIYGKLGGEMVAPALTYEGCGVGETPCRDGVLGCDMFPESGVALDELSQCIVAVQSLVVSASDLSPLRKLRSVKDNFWIVSSSQLTSLAGLEDFESAWDITIEDTPRLTDLSALSGVEVTELRIINAPLIASLEGLREVRYPPVPELGSGPALLLVNLPGLTELGPLDWVTRLDAISITNTSLRTLTGLSELTSLHTSFELVDNAQLTSLRALTNLTAARDVYIQGNRMLPTCEIDWLLKRIQYDPKLSDQSNNGPRGDCTDAR